MSHPEFLGGYEQTALVSCAEIRARGQSEFPLARLVTATGRAICHELAGSGHRRRHARTLCIAPVIDNHLPPRLRDVVVSLADGGFGLISALTRFLGEALSKIVCAQEKGTIHVSSETCSTGGSLLSLAAPQRDERRHRKSQSKRAAPRTPRPAGPNTRIRATQDSHPASAWQVSLE